jgi:hypothetical protein
MVDPLLRQRFERGIQVVEQGCSIPRANGLIDVEEAWREGYEENRILCTHDKPARVFCVAGVIGLTAVLGDSIPLTTNIAKKSAAASVRQHFAHRPSCRRTVDSRPRSR